MISYNLWLAIYENNLQPIMNVTFSTTSVARSSLQILFKLLWDKKEAVTLYHEKGAIISRWYRSDSDKKPTTQKWDEISTGWFR